MGMVSEFKTFIQRGNVMDLAVGVIIGGAFGKIVASLVDNVLMPVLGLLLGGVDFSKLALTIGGTAEAPILLRYGSLLQATLDFLILAFCVFLIVKAVNASQRKAPPAPAAPVEIPADVRLLGEIRDLLKARG
ncbi:MAG: large-conductance mechanosensitive channel protein MscL [Thermoanaerobaculia bacterium]